MGRRKEDDGVGWVRSDGVSLAWSIISGIGRINNFYQIAEPTMLYI